MEQVFERRPWLLPLSLALLTLLFLRPLIIPPGPNQALDGGDFVSFFYPMQTFIRQTVLSGELPLWNPHQFIGYSVAGDPQAGLFYPATWLLWLIGVIRGMNLAMALHVWLGAWGMAVLARRFRATYVASLLAGAIYAMSQWMDARLYAGHYTIVLAAAWIPWAMAAYDYALAQGSWLSVVPGIAFTGLLLLAGSPPMDVYGVIALLTLWLYHTAQAEAPLQAAWYAGKRLILIAIGGAVLGAATLLPAAQFTALTLRGSSDLAFANSFALPPAQYLGLALPGFFGDPKATDYTHYWGADFFQEFAAYAGLVPLLAIPLAFRWRRHEYWYFLALAAFGLVASIGLAGGLMPLLWEWIPGFASFRTPGRALYFVMFGLAGLTAVLVTSLQNSTPDERREALRPAVNRWIPLAVVGVFVGALIFSGWYASASHTEPMPMRAFLISGVLASAGVILLGIWFVLWLWTQDEPRTLHWALLLTCVFIILDAWHVGYPIIGISMINEDALWAGARINVRAGPDARVVAPGGMETEASATGLLNVAGYNPLVVDAYAKLTALGDPGNALSPVNTLLGVKYVLTTKPIDNPDKSGLKLIGIAPGGIYYERQNPFLRAWIAQNVVVADDDSVRSHIASGKEDLASSAYVDHPVDCPASGSPTASITNYQADSVTIHAAGGSGLLVLSDQYYPGWQATVDGQPVDISRADTVFRAVCVQDSGSQTGGEHVIRFDFQPTLFYIGALLSAIGWLLVIVVGTLALRGRKSQNRLV